MLKLYLAVLLTGMLLPISWAEGDLPKVEYDPTRPYGYVPAELANARPLHLQMIVKASGDQYAVINEHLVRVGAKLNGYTVVSIERYHIVLRRQGKHTVLEMSTNIVK